MGAVTALPDKQRKTLQAMALSWAIATEGTANCRKLGDLWSREERAIMAEDDPRDRMARVLGLTDYCRGCPVMGWCADLARLDEYTGVAGGAWVEKGLPKEAARVRRVAS